MHGTVLSLLAALPATLASPASKRSEAATGATLYAYGTNISALPILYSSGDDSLYIASNTTSNHLLAAITWDVPTLKESTSRSCNGSLSNGTAAGALMIEPAADAYDGVRVVRGQGNGTTTGLGLWGSQLVYYDGSAVQSEFWAEPSSSSSSGDGVWTLLWNSANSGAARDKAVPVTVKTTGGSSSG